MMCQLNVFDLKKFNKPTYNTLYQYQTFLKCIFWQICLQISKNLAMVRRCKQRKHVNPFMPNGAFNMCCPRDCVSRHNGGTSGTPLKPLRVDSALKALSSLKSLRGVPEVPPLCQETQSLQQMLELSCENATVGTNGLKIYFRKS